MATSCSDSGSGPRRISVTEAERLVRSRVFSDNPDMNPAAEFPLEGRTTDELWQRMKAQVFQVTDGVHYGVFYLIKDGKTQPLGTSAYGACGYGLSMQVTDLDNNGKPELTYTYESGSGIPYSHVAVYSEDWSEHLSVDTMINSSGGRLIVDKVNDQNVLIKIVFYKPQEEELVPVSTFSIGRVVLAQQGGVLQIVAELDDDLPAQVEGKLLR
jgi:hypothetical protein